LSAIIHFKGWPDPWHPTDSTGFNGTGYVTNTGIVIRPRRSRIARTSMEVLARRKHRLFDLSNHPRVDQIETTFTDNVINNAFYVAAMLAMADPGSPLWDHPVKIPILIPVSAEDHEARWANAISKLQKGDAIFTLDTKSFVSRTITYLDQGTWSHVATYVGSGRIVEAISPRVIERSIEAYNSPRYRMGIYRRPAPTMQQIDSLVGFLQSKVGDRYSYRKALSLGLRLALGIWPTGARRHVTPNMAIIRAGYDLIEIV